MKDIVRDLVPPIAWRTMVAMRRKFADLNPSVPSGEQDLNVYWDPRMAEMLETWGEGNAWNEVQLLLAGRKGRVLDIACGTGRTMTLFANQPDLELHGCDISDMLIDKAIARGIPKDRLAVGDATAMHYEAGAFDLGYSIGSLEHFTEDGIVKFLKECARVVSGPTFHMIPISRSGEDHGWIKTFQSYYNNSPTWWLAKCAQAYPRSFALPSVWEDDRSKGLWLVCCPQ
ncbi:class I SAM-dependent methyltransferase [Bradyrhizobium sp. HKCCYLS2038]|uniref:class I SAM-dependent methyltransferase n=1 Tax=unclassified Bradyrhizobium TaxID=2631580 RepID=UPI003EBF2EE9